MDEEKRLKCLRLKSYKYAILSLFLAIILLVSTGCAALLTGNNRKAYDLMVKASSYFKYPSSVQIVSGEVFDDSMFCVIRAKNGFGNYRSGAYFVSSSGYPLENSSRSCYSESLNCDLINSALAQHFGVHTSSSTNLLGNLMGGNNMSSNVTVFIYIVLLIVVLCLNGLLASNASDIADNKGYEKRKWFHMCFWLGPISYIIIAAMPDQIMRTKQDKTNALLNEMITAFDAAAKKQAKDHDDDDVSAYLPEI